MLSKGFISWTFCYCVKRSGREWKPVPFSHINESPWIYITWHDVMGIVLLLAELWMPRAEHQRKNTTLKVFLEHIWENLLVNANTCPNKYWFAFSVNAELANLTWHEEHCITNASFNWEILGVFWEEYMVGSMCLFWNRPQLYSQWKKSNQKVYNS